MAHMKHITRAMVADIINNNPEPNFDTHWIEQRVLRLHPVAFAEELLEFSKAVDPLKRFGSEFGKWIGATFANDVTKLRYIKSNHLGGEKGGNQEWIRVNSGVPVVQH